MDKDVYIITKTNTNSRFTKVLKDGFGNRGKAAEAKIGLQNIDNDNIYSIESITIHF